MREMQVTFSMWGDSPKMVCLGPKPQREEAVTGELLEVNIKAGS